MILSGINGWIHSTKARQWRPSFWSFWSTNLFLHHHWLRCFSSVRISFLLFPNYRLIHQNYITHLLFYQHFRHESYGGQSKCIWWMQSKIRSNIQGIKILSLFMLKRLVTNRILCSQTSCMYWLPVQFLNFLLIPPALRVTFVSIAAFCWVNILCYLKNTPVFERDDGNQMTNWLFTFICILVSTYQKFISTI